MIKGILLVKKYSTCVLITIQIHEFVSNEIYIFLSKASFLDGKFIKYMMNFYRRKGNQIVFKL